MADFRTEPAVPGDAPRLAELEALCFPEPRSRAALLDELSDPGRHLLLAARREGELAGYVGLEYVLDEGYITDVAVFPRFRRQGAAQALLTELARRGRAMGLSFSPWRCGRAMRRPLPFTTEQGTGWLAAAAIFTDPRQRTQF